jgi:hypothetical protein
MLKKIGLWPLVILLLIAAGRGLPTAAQPDAPWRLIISESTYNETSGYSVIGIREVTAAGLGELLLIYGVPEGSLLQIYDVSPDLRYAVGSLTPTDFSRTDQVIIDLSSGQCCTYVQANYPPYAIFSAGVFSPDGSQVALAWSNFDYNTGANPGGSFAVIDPATGAVIQEILQPDYNGYLVDWREDGVYFLWTPGVPTEWLPEGYLGRWNPAINEFVEATDEFMPFWGDKLALNGEMVLARYNENFPVRGFEGMFGPTNVVAYFAPGEVPYNADFSVLNPGRVVFYNPDLLDVPLPYWIADGNAFLLTTDPDFDGYSDQAWITRRDASQSLFALSPAQSFLVGTPQGFITYDSNLNLYHHLAEGDTFVPQVIGQLQATPRAVVKPALGTTATAQIFPEVTRQIPPTPPDAITCPGFLPSRLQVGSEGWVLPGEDNNLRSDPTTSSAEISVVMAGTVFTVLDGPVCADNTAWWQVETVWAEIGWTAEGLGDNYWLEPLR